MGGGGTSQVNVNDEMLRSSTVAPKKKRTDIHLSSRFYITELSGTCLTFHRCICLLLTKEVDWCPVQ